MTALNFPVLLRTTRLDVAVAHAGGLHGQLKRERELRPVVALNLPNGERKRVRQLAENIEAGVVIESRVEPKHAHPRAIVQCGVLKDFLLRQLHDFDVHLDGVARMLLLEQLHLPRAPTRRLRQDWHTNVTEHALNRSRVDPQRVDALEPTRGCGAHPNDARFAPRE